MGSFAWFFRYVCHNAALRLLRYIEGVSHSLHHSVASEIASQNATAFLVLDLGLVSS